MLEFYNYFHNILMPKRSLTWIIKFHDRIFQFVPMDKMPAVLLSLVMTLASLIPVLSGAHLETQTQCRTHLSVSKNLFWHGWLTGHWDFHSQEDCCIWVAWSDCSSSENGIPNLRDFSGAWMKWNMKGTIK